MSDDLLSNLSEGTQNVLKGAFTTVKGFATSPTGAGVVGAVAGVGGTLAVMGVAKRVKKRKKTTKRKTTKRRTTKRRTTKKRKSSRVRKTPRTAGKGKDRSTKRIRYTKKGQPYVIMKSGKARFIKKSSAKRSHKVKGGRY